MYVPHLIFNIFVTISKSYPFTPQTFVGQHDRDYEPYVLHWQEELEGRSVRRIGGCP